MDCRSWTVSTYLSILLCSCLFYPLNGCRYPIRIMREQEQQTAQPHSTDFRVDDDGDDDMPALEEVITTNDVYVSSQ